MTIICTLGGCAFLAIGVLNLIQGITWTADTNTSWIQGLPFIAAGINLTIGLRVCSSAGISAGILLHGTLALTIPPGVK